jgi:hypothetical protein
VNRTRFFIDLARRLDTPEFRGSLERADVIAAGRELWRKAFHLTDPRQGLQ